MERVFAGARKGADEASRFGHDFFYAEGITYFRFRS
jgi:hypothetical protein